jgi:uncharacterized ParB-like nuclease family protein
MVQKAISENADVKQLESLVRSQTLKLRSLKEGLKQGEKRIGKLEPVDV